MISFLDRCNKRLEEYKLNLWLRNKDDYGYIQVKHPDLLPEVDKVFWDKETRPKIVVDNLLEIIDSLCDIIEKKE